jgi:hypothetical protein
MNNMWAWIRIGWMAVARINRKTSIVYAPQIQHVLASDRAWAERKVSVKTIHAWQPVWTIVCRHAERVPVRRHQYQYAGIITPSRALLQQPILQFSVQHNYMSFMSEQLNVSALTDHHQAISTVFKNKAKNVIRMDSSFIIITAWNPTSGHCWTFRR